MTLHNTAIHFDAWTSLNFTGSGSSHGRRMNKPHGMTKLTANTYTQTSVHIKTKLGDKQHTFPISFEI